MNHYYMMMEYEGVKKIKTTNVVEKVTNDESVVDVIADLLSSLGSQVNMDSIYEALYLAYIYCREGIIDDKTYVDMKRLKRDKELVNIVNNTEIKHSFYFIYGSYAMISNVTIIGYRYYIVSVIRKKGELIVRVEELKEYQGTSIGRIRMR